MPWKVYSEDDKYCVYKLDENDEKDEKLKCYDSKKEADDYAAALYAAEEEKGMKSTEEPVEEPENSEGEDEGSGEEQDDSQKHINKKDLSEEGEDPAPAFKMMSFNEKINHVREAWYDEYDYRGYVNEVYEDHVIVGIGKKAYRVPYATSGDGITFGSEAEWREVEMKREWVEKSLYTIKALGEDRIGGWAVIYGSESEKDLHEEFFTEETEEYDAIFKATNILPWLVHHAADDTLKTTVVGLVDTLEEKEEDDVAGWWYEAKIKEHEIYRDYVEPLVKRRALATSSGTLPAAKRVTKSGHITRWPISEITGTWLPADYRQVNVPIHTIEQIKSMYKSAGIDPAVLEKFATKSDELPEEDTIGVEEARKKLQAQVDLRAKKLKLLRLSI